MDLEARAHSEHPESLRLWLRLLTCTQLIEKQGRGQLRTQFDTTLPRFDLMAQLERAPEGSRQKGTIQLKVQILNPDRFLTPELSANVDFLKE